MAFNDAAQIQAQLVTHNKRNGPEARPSISMVLGYQLCVLLETWVTRTIDCLCTTESFLSIWQLTACPGILIDNSFSGSKETGLLMLRDLRRLKILPRAVDLLGGSKTQQLCECQARCLHFMGLFLCARAKRRMRAHAPGPLLTRTRRSPFSSDPSEVSNCGLIWLMRVLCIRNHLPPARARYVSNRPVSVNIPYRRRRRSSACSLGWHLPSSIPLFRRSEPFKVES